MNRKVGVIALLSVGIVLSGCSGGLSTPSDERPAESKTVARKYIDPEHGKWDQKCARKDSKGKCIRHKRYWKVTDDKDWVIVTTDGSHWDVEESEYNTVNVGDTWPN